MQNLDHVFSRVRAWDAMKPDDAFTAARMRSLAQLARPTVHDLRGTLGSMTMHLDLLASVLADQADEPARERSRRYLEVLRQECRRLQLSAEAFLDLASLARETGEVDVASLVGRVIDAVRPLANARRVRLELGECEPEACDVPDRESSRQRLLDALLDVLAAAPPGSIVRMELVPAQLRVRMAIDDAAPIDVPLLASAEPGDA